MLGEAKAILMQGRSGGEWAGHVSEARPSSGLPTFSYGLGARQERGARIAG
jgi:hypothetical protein